jgi:hypothetical protein
VKAPQRLVKGRKLFVIALLAVLPVAAASAGGAGGTGFGAQYFDPGLSNVDHQLLYISGFGYGTSTVPYGRRIGGFGMAILSQDHVGAGGVGGMLMGQEFRSGPIVAGITLFYGLGGMAYEGAGYALLFGEADLELGISLLWMQVTAYAGYQAWGNLVPGFPLRSAVVYTPVLGVRVAWGSF